MIRNAFPATIKVLGFNDTGDRSRCSVVRSPSPWRNITDSDADFRGSGDVSGRIPRYGGQGVPAIARRGRVPRDRIGYGRQFGPEVHPIELKLHPHNTYVVRGVG